MQTEGILIESAFLLVIRLDAANVVRSALAKCCHQIVH
jgi:hypothetical protein